ncbi:membrane protein insertase YidC [Glaciecola sp. 1036]|uniref:membrane protein insertase YidC n=1 Tax=Alteromonadaceae TaxID=72275 RepID=UPI003D08C3E0
MESQRSILIIGLALFTFLLWLEFQDANAPAPVKTQEQVQQEIAANNAGSVPGESSDSEDNFVPQATNAALPQVTNTAANANRIVTVTTDTLSLEIDTHGGDVIEADLRKYPITQDGDDSYPLLSKENATYYVAQSGLIAKGIDTQQGRARYSVAQNSYEMTGDTLEVPLTITTADNLTVVKTFTFTKGSHAVDVSYTVTNNGNDAVQVQQYGQLKQSLAERSGGSMFMPTYRGGAFGTQDDSYEKFSFGDFEDEKLNLVTTGGWISMLEHYFISAWVPPQDLSNEMYSRVINNRAIIGFKGEAANVQAGETKVISSILYMGPKDQDVLSGLSKGLNLTVDYGILWWISVPLFTFLQWIHSIVGNWGVAIIIITLVVKGAMYYLTKKQYESMAKMRVLSPKLQQLKDRFGDDRQKMSQAMMELYKKEKVNPMGGCFPLLLQMPIFLALYWVLLESVELRHADFAFWITDLSVADPYLVLPILTAISMYLLQKLQPMTVQDPMQQKIFQFMPVAMGIFFMFFPAGLVLYWLISNIVTLVQAKMIYASMEKRGLKTR